MGSNDPGAEFASDFLGGLVSDGLATHPPAESDPLGQFIAANEDRRGVRQSVADLFDGVLDAPNVPTDDRIQLAAGDGFLGDINLPESWVRSGEFARGFVDGGGISILQSYDALASIAREPGQFIDGVHALLTSSQARSQFGAELLRGVESDVQMFRDAYDAGDMRIAGQQFGKLTADLAQLVGGVEALVRIAPSLARGAGRGATALVDAARDVRFGGSSGSSSSASRIGQAGAVGDLGAARTGTGGGIGTWTSVNESMPARAAAYQSQITGQSGQAYVVNGVKFDGYANGALLEAKGPGYSAFVNGSGEFKPWFNGQQSLLNQAYNQLEAANGIPIVWHVAEPSAATAIRNLLQSNGFGNIRIVNTAPK